MYLITNGLIITEETMLEGFDLLIREDRIARIARQGEIEPEEGMEVIDAAGGYISAGFIDIHSDYIERMTAPRPTALMDFGLGLREAEKVLISHGITTMYHSLGIDKSADEYNQQIRKPENVKKLMDLIDQAHATKHLIRHRIHVRFEIDSIAEIENLKRYIAERKVHLVSFMDHTPGQGQYRNLEVYKKKLKAQNQLGYKQFTDEGIDEFILMRQTKPKLTEAGIREIAQLAAAHQIPIASHDDDSIEKLELLQDFGAVISEFPITLDIARQAKEKGMYTVAGAPNVLLGGSHNGNLFAAEAIQQHSIDILCSDYYPASLLHAVFYLANHCQMDLVEMFKLVSLNPARAVGIDKETGSIREGKKADLLVIEKIEPDFPVITTVLVDGKLIQKTNYRIG